MSLSPRLLRNVALPTAAALVIGVGIGLVAPLSPASADVAPYTKTTPGTESYTLPSWATAARVEIKGAQGGGDKGGKGGSVSAILPLSGGTSIQVNVGGQGTNLVGGGNGGGAPGSGLSTGTNHFGGGGASDIRVGGTALGDRQFVAGGGGGGGDQAGGKGGAPAGTDGIDGILAYGYGSPGKGGTQSAGGAGGAVTGSDGTSGIAGASGDGGVGGDYAASDRAGAGGGGGYFGGGGGGAGRGTGSFVAHGYGGPGGGGSSYATGTATNVTFDTGAKTGDGSVTITPMGLPTVTTGTATAINAGRVTLHGTGVTNNAAISDAEFFYSTTSGQTCSRQGAHVEATPASKISGTLAFSANLSGLAYGTTYYYCAAVSTGQGNASGTEQSFAIGGEPQVTTGNPIALLTQDDEVTVQGTVNPNSVATTAVMRYSTSQAVVEGGGGQTATVSPGSWPDGTATTRSVTSTITGLTANTTYYYQLQATNTVGTGNGGVNSVTTKIGPANTVLTMPSNPVGNRSSTFPVRVATFDGVPLTGPVTLTVTNPLNQVSTLCIANVTNGSGSCSGSLLVGTNLINAKFNNGQYIGDSGAAVLKVLGVSTNVAKVSGSGSNRKVNLTGKTYKKKQSVVIYKRKGGKTTRIGTATSNNSGAWSRKGLKVGGGDVYVFTKLKKMVSNKVRV
ncbi:MAG TPA: hypothetical protein DCQ04_05880 [Actinobacteria bacterium]|nr:hypothetical protein [Actinomycetota bacterium]